MTYYVIRKETNSEKPKIICETPDIDCALLIGTTYLTSVRKFKGGEKISVIVGKALEIEED